MRWEDLEAVETAEERGMQMMQVPMGQLPLVARKFAEKLCREVGMCMEVLLTAWMVYAQCVEGLPCKDELYIASPEHVRWFEQQKAESSSD